MTNLMKGALLHATLVASLAIFTSCDNNQPTDAKEAAEDRNEERFDNNDNKQDDAQFLVDAAEMNHEEIHMGQLAQQKGSSPEVRELGKMMEDAHTKSLNELKALAMSKNVTIPNTITNDTRDDYNDFNDKSAEDFDKDYADRVVNKHEDAIDKFENAAEDSHDPEIKRWASSSLSELRTHLRHAKESQQNIDNLNSNRNTNNKTNTNRNASTTGNASDVTRK